MIASLQVLKEINFLLIQMTMHVNGKNPLFNFGSIAMLFYCFFFLSENVVQLLSKWNKETTIIDTCKIIWEEIQALWLKIFIVKEVKHNSLGQPSWKPTISHVCRTTNVSTKYLSFYPFVKYPNPFVLVHCWGRSKRKTFHALKVVLFFFSL